MNFVFWKRMSFHSLQELQQALAPRLKTLFGEQLVGAIAHGACVAPNFRPGKVPWEVSLFLRELTPQALPGFTQLHDFLHKGGIRLDYVFTQEMVENAADTFPLEFLDLSEHSFLLCGSFPLADFHPQPHALRLQCERELRGLHIHMHREFVLHSHKEQELLDLIRHTFPRFLPVLRSIYWIYHGRPPANEPECLLFLDKHWQLGNVFSRLARPPKNKQELQWLCSEYLLAIDKILKTIDSLEVPS